MLVTCHKANFWLQGLNLGLALWVKFSAGDILKYFDFSKKTGFDISSGDNLLEVSNPVFWEKYEKYHLSSAEIFIQHGKHWGTYGT